MRPATGSHSLRQTSSVAASHSPRLHAVGTVSPDGSSDSGSSHRSASLSASMTSAFSAAVTGGSPTGFSSASGSSFVGAGMPMRLGRPKPNTPPGMPLFPVRCACATWRARSQFTGPPLVGAENICCS
jgi:hypothetical protein